MCKKFFKILIASFAIVFCSCTKDDDYSDISYGTMTDQEGNVYKTITIGTQTWMAENLRTTTYNDGTVIPNVTDNDEWADLSTPAYCWYDNDSATYAQTYGALYNWYTVATDSLCPTGWHVPTDAEWTILTDTLGGLTIAGGLLKETGTTHWTAPTPVQPTKPALLPCQVAVATRVVASSTAQTWATKGVGGVVLSHSTIVIMPTSVSYGITMPM